MGIGVVPILKKFDTKIVLTYIS